MDSLFFLNVAVAFSMDRVCLFVSALSVLGYNSVEEGSIVDFLWILLLLIMRGELDSSSLCLSRN